MSLADGAILLQIETILRWDVRTVCTAKELYSAGSPGDLILAQETLIALSGVQPVAELVGSGRRLFRVTGPS